MLRNAEHLASASGFLASPGTINHAKRSCFTEKTTTTKLVYSLGSTGRISPVPPSGLFSS